jgi:hypothetical protein
VQMIIPGSSLIISDQGLGDETERPQWWIA